MYFKKIYIVFKERIVRDVLILCYLFVVFLLSGVYRQKLYGFDSYIAF